MSSRLLSIAGDWQKKHPTVSRIASNTGWLLADRITRGAVSVVFGILIARSLGPAAFGELGFSQALTAVTGVFGLLGLEAVVVRNMVRNPRDAAEILGSAAMLRLAGASCGFVVAMAAIRILHPENPQSLQLVAALAAGSLFQASDVIELQFQATSRFRLTAVARLAACLANAALRAGLLLAGAPVTAFAWALTFELALGALILFLAYRRLGGARWIVRIEHMRELIRDAWPLAASALLTMAYMRADQLMLGQMLGASSLGVYMAAVRLTEMWYIIPVALAATAFPHIVAARQQGSEAFLNAVFGLYRVLGCTALLLGVVLALAADAIIAILYGPQYDQSASVLRIYAWATIPVFLGMASERYLIATGHTGVALVRTLLGFVANVGLNIVLIPRLGAAGAAWATAASYFVSVFSLLGWREHRSQVWLMLRALAQRPLRRIHVAA